MQAPIYFDDRWCGLHGIGRFAWELQQRLVGIQPLTILGPKLSPIDPLTISVALCRKKNGCYLSPGFNPPLRSPIPITFTIHDLIHLKVPSESTRLRRLYYEHVVRPATRKAHCILTVSNHAKQDILQWSGLSDDRVYVVGSGVSEAFRRDGPVHMPGYPYLLHVGRRASHKNIDGLLTAFAQSRAIKDLFLVCTGVSDASTCRYAESLGIRSRVKFAGNLSDENLASLYRGARALVFPSLYEGFGIPIVEAMGCGTPVITSDSTATAEIAGTANALLVEPRDTDALCNAIDQIIDDEALRQLLVERGLLRSSSFRWDDVATRVAEALKLSI